MIKYLIIGFPIILLFLSCFSKLDLNNSILSFLTSYINSLKNIEINQWYSSILDLLKIDYSTTYSLILSFVPLHILWVYIFDIILDVFCFVPKIAHRFIEKCSGGDKY